MMNNLFDFELNLQALYWGIMHLNILFQQGDHGVNLSFLSFILSVFICLWYQCNAAGFIKGVPNEVFFPFLLHVIIEQHWC